MIHIQQRIPCFQVIAGKKGILPLLEASKEKGSAAVKEKACQVYEKLVTLVKKREQEKGTKTGRDKTVLCFKEKTLIASLSGLILCLVCKVACSKTLVTYL